MPVLIRSKGGERVFFFFLIYSKFSLVKSSHLCQGSHSIVCNSWVHGNVGY